MSQNVPGKRLTNQQSKAALLVADGLLTTEQIGEQVGVARKTVERWKAQPEFAAYVETIKENARKALEAEGIANKRNRIAAYNDRWRRLQAVIDERAARYEGLVVPGGKSGLLVHTQKQIGGGEFAQVVDEYAVDTGLLRETRELEKQAAIEMGQWTEKHEHLGKDGESLTFTIKLDNADSGAGA